MAEDFLSNQDLCSKLAEYLDLDTILSIDESGIFAVGITPKHLFIPYLRAWQNRLYYYGFNDEHSVMKDNYSKYTLIPVSYKYSSDPIEFIPSLALLIDKNTFDQIDCKNDVNNGWIFKTAPVFTPKKCNKTDFEIHAESGKQMSVSCFDLKWFDGDCIDHLMENTMLFINKQRICYLFHIKTKEEKCHHEFMEQEYIKTVCINQRLSIQKLVKRWYRLHVVRDCCKRLSFKWDRYLSVFGEIDSKFIPKELTKLYNTANAFFLVLHIYEAYPCSVN